MSEKVKLEGHFEEGTFGEWLSGVIDKGCCWGQLIERRVLFSWEGFIKDWVGGVKEEAEEGDVGT